MDVVLDLLRVGVRVVVRWKSQQKTESRHEAHFLMFVAHCDHVCEFFHVRRVNFARSRCDGLRRGCRRRSR